MRKQTQFVLLCCVSDVVYHRWDVVLAHLMETVVKVLMTWFQLDVTATIDITSAVGKPDIIAVLGELKG